MGSWFQQTGNFGLLALQDRPRGLKTRDSLLTGPVNGPAVSFADCPPG